MKQQLKGIEIKNLEQNTPGWLKWRNGDIENNEFRIGGSEAAVIMGVNAWTSVDELYERKLGLLPDIETNEAMERGHRLEPVARVEFEMETGVHVHPACYISEPFPFMAASLDGISYDGQSIIEIKCPGMKTHSEALKGNIPVYYIPQIQHQLAVTGAKKAYYYSYTDVPDVDNVLIEVFPDEAYIERLIERETLFVQCLKDRTPPPNSIFGVGDAPRDNTDRTDPMWRKAMQRWASTNAVLEDALAQHGASEDEIMRLMQRKKQVTATSEGFFVERKLEGKKWKLYVSTEGSE